jgi:hypothetical protein
MPRRKRNAGDTRWNVWPPASLAYAVAALAQREGGQTVPAMIVCLVAEALKARVAANESAPTQTTALH